MTQGDRQASVRLVTGTALDYNGDFLALFTLKGIAAADFNGRMLAWLNLYLNTSYDNLPGAMAAFATANNATSFAAVGTFDASIGGSPANTVLPAISGTTTQGQTLSCTTGTWTNTPTSYAYQWAAASVNIGGATASTYLLTASEVGKTVTCTVTATNTSGSTPATSLATATIAALPGTLNASDKAASITLSNGNLTATSGAASTFASVRSQTSHSSGKYYWEWTVGQKGINNGLAGFLNSTESLSNYIGADANGIGLVTNGQTVKSATFTNTISTIANGDICGLAIDIDAHLLWVRDGAGNWNGNASFDPATGVGGISTPSGINSGAVFAGISVFNSSDFSTANFGASAFSQTIPSGFSAWG